MIVRVALLPLCLLIAALQTTSVAGRWQYLQPPDTEGEILDLFMSGGRWRGIMNGLERTGDHGLFYYVVEVEQLAIDADGTVRFEIGERSLFRQRPPLSRLGGVGEGGFVRTPMRFSGRIEGGDLILRCEDDDGSCPALTLTFKAQDRLRGLLALPEIFGAGPRGGREDLVGEARILAWQTVPAGRAPARSEGEAQDLRQVACGSPSLASTG